MRRNLEPAALSAALREADALPQALSKLYEVVEEKASESISWYLDAKRHQAFWSKSIRGFALALVGLGGLAPLLGAAGVPPPLVGWDKLGYLFLALAAALLAFDRFFGFSTAYTRYITTALALQRVLAELHLDWIALLSQRPAGAGNAPTTQPFLDRLKAAQKAVLDLIDGETQEWVAEFKSNVAELERMAKTQKEGLAAGTIEVTIKDGASDPVELWVDAVRRGTLQGTERAQIGSVAPGQHVVSARRGGATPREATALVVVPAGGVASATLAVG
ncbi:MAG TPA: SLATT domain-containing protein [Anaeromyxobacter sp.]|nr:SLATT domain-containing protein [Anaeromyxobacter sp.]